MNNYTIHDARLVTDLARKEFGESQLVEVRAADNPTRKTDKKGNPIKARFVTLKFWDFHAQRAGRLSKGDIISVTGELGIETFTDKEGKERDKDVLRVDRFSVSRSESYYAKADQAAPAEPAAETEPLPF